jgi:hypothetical protein
MKGSGEGKPVATSGSVGGGTYYSGWDFETLGGQSQGRIPFLRNGKKSATCPTVDISSPDSWKFGDYVTPGYGDSGRMKRL